MRTKQYACLSGTLALKWLVAMSAALVLTLAAWEHPAAAQQGRSDLVWQVIEANGDIRVRSDAAPASPWRPLKAGENVSARAEIETGSDGRGVLAHDGSRITISANSQMALPDHVPAGAVYRVVQRVGTVLFKIVHASKDKFQVETPYLTTVIKGTTFSVSVNGSGGSVHVTEGAVLVRPLNGEAAMVTPGQTARVPASSRGGVIINGRAGSNGSNGRATAAASAPGTNAAEKNAAVASGDGTKASVPARAARPVTIVFEHDKGSAGNGRATGNGPVGDESQANRSSANSGKGRENAGGNAGNATADNPGRGNGGAAVGSNAVGGNRGDGIGGGAATIASSTPSSGGSALGSGNGGGLGSGNSGGSGGGLGAANGGGSALGSGNAGGLGSANGGGTPLGGNAGGLVSANGGGNPLGGGNAGGLGSVNGGGSALGGGNAGGLGSVNGGGTIVSAGGGIGGGALGGTLGGLPGGNTSPGGGNGQNGASGSGPSFGKGHFQGPLK